MVEHANRRKPRAVRETRRNRPPILGKRPHRRFDTAQSGLLGRHCLKDRYPWRKTARNEKDDERTCHARAANFDESYSRKHIPQLVDFYDGRKDKIDGYSLLIDVA